MKFKKTIYIFSTIVFILFSPVLFILSIIPILFLGLYLKSWDSWHSEKYDNFRKIDEDMNRQRADDLIPILKSLIPSDAKSALDIGSGGSSRTCYKRNFARGFFDRYICLDVNNADIKQDLNIESRIKLPSNSVDIVILSNILEHLVNPIPIALEANRIAKKYLIIGLPNEFPLGERLFTLFGFYYDKFYPLGHKHRLSLKSIGEFIYSIWGGYSDRIYKFHFIGVRFIPSGIKNILMRLFPSLFVGEVFYLVKKKEQGKSTTK